MECCEELLKVLKEKRVVKFTELVRILKCHESTVRKCLSELEEKNRVCIIKIAGTKKTRGTLARRFENPNVVRNWYLLHNKERIIKFIVEEYGCESEYIDDVVEALMKTLLNSKTSHAKLVVIKR